jgi:hypothetical protein
MKTTKAITSQTPLLLQTTTMHCVTYRELQRYIHQELGIHHCIISSEELHRDSEKLITVNSTPARNLDAAALAAALKGLGGIGSTELLLCELCRRGKIKPGEYLINV